MTPTSTPNTNSVVSACYGSSQATTDTVPEGKDYWCWATQAAEALLAIQQLVTTAKAASQNSVESTSLAEQVYRLYRILSPRYERTVLN